jgi:hypothetical protein
MPLMKTKLAALLLAVLLFPGTLPGQPKASTYDLLIKGGTVGRALRGPGKIK